MDVSELGQSVRYEVDQGVVRIILDRPSVLNAINADMRRSLPVAIRRAEADRDVRVIVICGSGDRAFSTGADITEFVEPKSIVEARAERVAMKWTDALAEVPKPTVAAIHGYCLGGGLETALACDIRVASSDAIFGLPEVRLGIIPGAGGTQRLSRVVGLGHALRLILSGERIDAPEAFRIGLVSMVVPREDLDTAVADLAHRIAKGAPRALAHAKEAVRRGWELPLPDGLRLEADLSALLLNTKDRAEGAAAFKEHREPSYSGQ